MTGELAPAVMTESEARHLTARIRQHVEDAYELLYDAYARKAWAALGYRSFKGYVQAEFSMSRARAYQLLNQAKVVREISAVASTSVDISEAAARELGPMVPVVVERVRSTLGSVPSDPEATQQLVNQLVSEARNEIRAEREREERQTALRKAHTRGIERAAEVQAPVEEDRAPVQASQEPPSATRIAWRDRHHWTPPAGEDMALPLAEAAVRDAHHSAWNALNVLEGLNLERVGRLLTPAERTEYAERADTMEVWLARYRVALWSAAAADDAEEEAP